MTQQTSTSKIEDRIRKLLAKASDSAVTPEEAAAFAAKAQAMLIEHGLDEQSVVSAAARSSVHQTVWAAPYAEDSWRKMIATSAAPVFMCKMLMTKVSDIVVSRTTGEHKLAQRTAYILIGTPERTAVLQSVLEYLYTTIVRLARQHSSVRRDQLSFMRGAGVAVSARLRDMVERPEAVASTGTALVLVSQALAEVQSFTEQNFPGMRKRSIRISGGSGYSAGHRAGQSISLDPQLEASRPAPRTGGGAE